MRSVVMLPALLSFASLLFGCAPPIDARYKYHALTIDGKGQLLLPVDKTGRGDYRLRADEAESPTRDDLKRYEKTLDDVFLTAQSSPKDEILIFIHGGLNSLASSTERVNRLINQADLQEKYYPILVNWDSGLFESYGDHLFRIRQGEVHKSVAVATSPFYFAADLGRGLVRAPIDMVNTTYRDLQAIPVVQEYNKYHKNAELIYDQYRRFREFGQADDHVQVVLGKDLEWGRQTLYKVPVNLLTWPVQLIASPFVDAIGTPSWESMQRRTKFLFDRSEKYNIEKDKNEVSRALRAEPASIMSMIAERLKKLQSSGVGGKKITVVGHSMGTIVVNELIRRYPEIRFSEIVYMAAADSIRNTFNSVLPYMQAEGNEKVRFYNLVLHPQNELEEATLLLSPRGSLLVWIDDFFSTPHTSLDRTAGRWTNLLPTLGDIETYYPDARKRVVVKAFDQTAAIARHGDFSRARFWDAKFRTIGEDLCCPWPEGRDGFYDK